MELEGFIASCVYKFKPLHIDRKKKNEAEIF